jgi:hypothetical protein
MPNAIDIINNLVAKNKQINDDKQAVENGIISRARGLANQEVALHLGKALFEAIEQHCTGEEMRRDSGEIGHAGNLVWRHHYEIPTLYIFTIQTDAHWPTGYNDGTGGNIRAGLILFAGEDSWKLEWNDPSQRETLLGQIFTELKIRRDNLTESVDTGH